jgi:tricorn protease
MADDVWIYDFNTKQLENVTNNPALGLFPMWRGDKMYFVSDRDKNKRVNLYVCELDGKQTRKLTDFSEFDIKFPSLGDNAIVFENGGFIYRFDLEKEESNRIEIQILRNPTIRSRA